MQAHPTVAPDGQTDAGPAPAVSPLAPQPTGALAASPPLGFAATALVASASLTACGGGGSSGSSSAAPTPSPTPTPVVPTITPADAQASRFLTQASMGADRAQIARVRSVGYAAWIDEQCALPQSQSRCDWMASQGYDAVGTNNANKNGFTGLDASLWRKLIASPDTLRQRVALALSEIVVVSAYGLTGGWRGFAAAHFMDLLENHAFGNYRTLLQDVSTSPAMGEYLTYRGSVKYNATTGAMPDENYARELMQLFTIGLVKLNIDGSPALLNGKQQDTYTQDDITGLARIFTGWGWDTTLGTATPDYQRQPMVMTASAHESGASAFLGTTMAANTDGVAHLNAALDVVFAHANVAPFVSKQLIQRLVTSNPTAAYVQRVATVFANDGAGVKGNLKAVIKAILLDDEARNDANVASTTFGKLREPILRLTGWARAFGASPPSADLPLYNPSDPRSLGQSPLHAPTVFNFFRPGYAPPNSAVATAGLVAPEFQLINESSVVGYINYMQGVVSAGLGDIKTDYAALVALATDPQALVNEVNLVLAANQLSSTTAAAIASAVGTIPSGTTVALNNRIYAAVLLVLASPEFMVQK